MTPSIPGTLPAQPADTTAPAPAVKQQAPQTQPSDTVTLSQSAQVSQLHEQGQNPSEIAENLGIPVSTVDSDLGIVAATVAAKPTAAPPATAPETRGAASDPRHG
jgi:DNA-directed RNA polymerase specialized sigma24 family protein